MEYTQIDYTKDTELTNLANFLAIESISTMNSVSYAAPQNHNQPLCGQAEIDAIHSFEILKIDVQDELVRIGFSVKNKANSSISSTFLVSPVSLMERVIPKKHYKLYYDSSEAISVFREYRIYAKLVGIERIDKFEGPCEQQARSLQLVPDFCFCK
jgi:hypothetical protein